MDNEMELSETNFHSEVLKSKIPVLVDFWAEWCMPCRMVSPVIDALAIKYGEKIKVRKLNVDEHNKLAVKYGITSIPALIIFKKGKIFKRHIGVASKKVLDSFITESLQ